MRKNHHVFLSAFLCALLVFTVYVLLDTFVIERRMEVVTEPQTVNAQLGGETGTTVSDTPVSLQLAASQEETAEPVITENSYHDGNISIEITEERIGDTTVYSFVTQAFTMAIMRGRSARVSPMAGTAFSLSSS